MQLIYQNGLSCMKINIKFSEISTFTNLMVRSQLLLHASITYQLLSNIFPTLLN